MSNATHTEDSARSAMMKPSTANLRNLLMRLDWSGHVELPDNDLAWLAEQLAAHLSAKVQEVCDICSRAMPIVVETALGNICSDCLEEATDTADSIKEVLTGGDLDARSIDPAVSLARGHL